MTITKQEILDKTHYGTNIYAHILRLYYPDEIVMTIKGRDCGIVRNPFNANKETLHIWIEKVETDGRPSHIARHKDTENAIHTGDAFSFAELHYKQKGDELLATLNKEIFLHIGEKRGFYSYGNGGFITQSYSKTPQSQSHSLGCVREVSFSFFRAPITNTKPHKTVTLWQIYNAIKGNFYKKRTQKLRAMNNPAQARHFKTTNFDYCTFSGVLKSRSDKNLIKHSGLLCVDFDHLNNVETLFNRLLQDEYFETQLLFRSPSGNGLKWIISINVEQYSHAQYFNAVANYIKQTYNVTVDKSGRDISRACFLPHDPQAFINPLYKLSTEL